jgi:hypothetical protein
MKHSVEIVLFAILTGSLCTLAVLAQSTSDQQTQSSPQTQQSQPNQDQYSGVSHPPPDSTIQANEDLNPPPPTAARPSAAIAASTTSPPTPPPVEPAVNNKPVSASVAAAIVDAAVVPGSSPFSGEVDNTDSGIVTVVPAPDRNPPLEQRPSSDGSDNIVGYVPINPNDLSPGTNISVRLSQAISTASTQAGTAFRATVDHDVYNGSRLVIPAGSEMRGRVVSVSQGHHLGIHAELRLRPDAIYLPDGTSYRIYADVVQSNAPGTRATDEGAIRATNHYGKDSLEYGGTMGTGAVVGAVVGGPVGAGVGTLVGAGVVTTHLLIQDPLAARLPQGTELVFSLTQPMGLSPTKD